MEKTDPGVICCFVFVVLIILTLVLTLTTPGGIGFWGWFVLVGLLVISGIGAWYFIEKNREEKGGSREGGKVKEKAREERERVIREEKERAVIASSKNPLDYICRKIAQNLDNLRPHLHDTKGPLFTMATDFREKVQTLLKSCEPQPINRNWWGNLLFRNRRELITSALDAYAKKAYTSCIQTLLPQIKAIMNEWIAIYVLDNQEVEKIFANILRVLEIYYRDAVPNVSSCGLLVLFADTLYDVSKSCIIA